MNFKLLFWLVFTAWGTPKALPIEKFTAHPFLCRNCHEAQYDFWEKTSHASAYVTLFRQGQHFNPECVSCHTLGFRHPGGFQKLREGIRGKVSSIDFMQSLEPRTDTPAQLKSRYYDKIHALEKSGEITQNFLGVQCEHCHGIRGSHPGGSKSKKVSLTTCKSCHTSERSPHFQADWIAKIACPSLKK